MSRLDFLRSLQNAREQLPALSAGDRRGPDALVAPAAPADGRHDAGPSDSDAPHSAEPAGNLDELEEKLHVRLVKAIDPATLEKLPPEGRRALIVHTIETILATENSLLAPNQRQRLIQDLVDETLGLGPLEQVLRDANVSDILINGASKVYVERRGRLEHSPLRFHNDEHLLEIIRRIIARVGRRVDDASPMVDARLQDGSRVNAIIPPLSLTGPMLSIRRFGAHRLRVGDLIELHALAPEMAQFLELAVRAKLNMLISGGTGSGKTTLLNALSAFIPGDERIITIEDAAELSLQQEHVGQLESRPPNVEGKGEVTIRDLLRNALRMRPNRIIIGECRGAEALDMLQAMNTGHEGSMSTLHANSPRDALSRLEMMIMMTGLDLPLKATRQQIASSIHLIVQVGRLIGGARKITSVTEVVGMEQDTITLQELFIYRQTGVDLAGRATGQFEATGVRPRCEPRFTAAGMTLAADLFRQGNLPTA